MRFEQLETPAGQHPPPRGACTPTSTAALFMKSQNVEAAQTAKGWMADTTGPSTPRSAIQPQRGGQFRHTPQPGRASDTACKGSEPDPGQVPLPDTGLQGPDWGGQQHTASALRDEGALGQQLRPCWRHGAPGSWLHRTEVLAAAGVWGRASADGRAVFSPSLPVTVSFKYIKYIFKKLKKYGE